MDEKVELINQTTEVLFNGVKTERENEESESRRGSSSLNEHPTRQRKTKYPKN
jgi:hypothetical protein